MERRIEAALPASAEALPTLIDNRPGNTLLEAAKRLMPTAHSLDIATGYFEVGALVALEGAWQEVSGTIRLLMGDEMTRSTKAAILEGLGDRRRNGIEQAKVEDDWGAVDHLQAIRNAIATGKILPKVYTRAKFHAKSMHYKTGGVVNHGIIGSSNFTRRGMTENIELNLFTSDNSQLRNLEDWFERAWEEAEDIQPDLLKIIEPHVREYSPFEVYLRAMRERFFGLEPGEITWEREESRIYPILAQYQRDAYHDLMRHAKEWGGGLLCDGVGLGKTHVALMLIERARREKKKVLVIVPKATIPSVWQRVLSEHFPDDTGSYYTPREIVQFMCREALVGYLANRGLTENKARKLLYEHDDSELSNQEGNLAFEALKEIKVVDPACGSGAYLLGMLQELYALFELLRRDDRKFSDDPAKEAHDRKLWIIENNLYGVDIQQFATNTAMLRLWLTLVVEDTGAKPQPLPNLEYKIETGDSLLGPDPSLALRQVVTTTRKRYSKGVASGKQYDMDVERDAMIYELRKRRQLYQNAHGPEKTTVKEALEAKLADLREKVTGKREKDPAKFDWRVEFFDVFLDDPAKRNPGFDVVLANPPYVRQELIRDQKPALRAVYGDLFAGTADLYCYFYFRGVQLLKAGGMFAFISSNKWFRAAYGEKLRRFMAESTKILSITDFGELPVFSAATFPMIFVAQKVVPASNVAPASSPVDENRRDGGATFTQVKSLDPPYPDVKALIQQGGFSLPAEAIQGSNWTLADRETIERLRKMESAGIPLGEYVKGKIYRGILTGFNRAFVIDGKKRAELIAEDPKSAEIIKPLAVGDDVRRWHIRNRDRWLIFTRRGIDIERYPAIKRHLLQWRTELEPRPRDWKPSKPGEVWRGRKPGSYKWYEIQDEIAYYAEFDKPKIVYPVIAKEPRFAYDTAGCFTNDKAFIIPTDDRFLAGVLNSAPAWNWMKHICSSIGADEEKGRLELRSTYLELLPIPRASEADREAIAALVQKCLDTAKVVSASPPNSPEQRDAETTLQELEAEIDARVEFIYFHQSEAPTYDAWLAKRRQGEG
ncbi:MAG: DNA methyltransferase [Armatimonadota bacterium]